MTASGKTDTRRTLSSLRVLVAEDNATNLDLCQRFLRELGVAQVTAAADGFEVLSILEADPTLIDVILMDVKMPRLDGIVTTREILRRWPNENTRPTIIAVTANVFEGEVRICLDAGMARCLSKPLRRKDLESALLELSHLPLLRPSAVEASGSIDWRQFDMIIDGKDSPCVAIFTKFTASVPELLDRVRQAASTSDAAEAGSVAHQLRGSSSSFGFVGFAAAMKEVEVVAKRDEDLTPYATKDWEKEALADFEAQRASIRQQRGI